MKLAHTKMMRTAVVFVAGRANLALATTMMATIVVLAACGTPEDFVFVRLRGADMPVWIRGNTASGKLLIFIQGGPGHPASYNSDLPAFKALERHYAVAYWDQRASGTSQGNPKPETLTLKQFAEDLDGVVNVFRVRSPSTKLVLLSHSWGGTVATAYLQDATRQAKVVAWIDVAGPHSMVERLKQCRLWAVERANERVVQGRDSEKWRRALEWYGANQTIASSNKAQHFSYYLDLAQDLLASAEQLPLPPSAGLLFFSPFSGFAYLQNYRYLQDTMVNSKVYEDIDGLDLTPKMSVITKPTLFLWGKNDVIVLEAVGRIAYDRIGTATASKTFTSFDRSGHFPFIAEPDAFIGAARAFLDPL